MVARWRSCAAAVGSGRSASGVPGSGQAHERDHRRAAAGAEGAGFLRWRIGRPEEDGPAEFGAPVERCSRSRFIFHSLLSKRSLRPLHEIQRGLPCRFRRAQFLGSLPNFIANDGKTLFRGNLRATRHRMEKPILLKVENLFVRYGETEVLEDISLEIAKGDFACLIGPNGAGKSTLLKTIMGLVPVPGSRVNRGCCVLAWSFDKKESRFSDSWVILKNDCTGHQNPSCR